MKGLVNIKNKDNKCFLSCHLNPLKTHPERIIKTDKKMVYGIDYEGLKFPVSIKVFSKIERKNKVCINMFCYENKLNYSVYISDQEFENCMDLLLISDQSKSHYVYIKDFNRFMCNKTKCKIKNTFADIAYNVAVVKKF